MGGGRWAVGGETHLQSQLYTDCSVSHESDQSSHVCPKHVLSQSGAMVGDALVGDALGATEAANESSAVMTRAKSWESETARPSEVTTISTMSPLLIIGYLDGGHGLRLVVDGCGYGWVSVGVYTSD